MKKEIERVSKEKIGLEEKINELIKNLDKIEYEEIIDGLRKRIEKKDIVKGGENKQQFNN